MAVVMMMMIMLIVGMFVVVVVYLFIEQSWLALSNQEHTYLLVCLYVCF